MRLPKRLLLRAAPPALILGLAAAHTAYLYDVTDGWIVDDAYISFRYVENWYRGLGLVFNEGERVEGYTNFLWVLLLGAARWLGLPLVESARALGVTASLAAVLLLYRIGAHQVGRRLGWVPAALYAVNHSLMTWSFGGLEVPLFLLWLLLGVYLTFVRPTRWAMLAFALMALTRPEGYLFLLLAAPLVAAIPSRSPSASRRWLPLGTAASMVAAHLIFKVAYYGALLPNTFHAKVGFHLQQLPRGFEYLGSALTSYGLLIPASALLLFGTDQRRWRGFLLTTLAGYAGYVVYAGGDPLPGYRLALPLLPLGWLGVVTLLERMPGRSRLGTAALVALLLANGVSQGIPGTPKGRVFDHFRNDKVADCGRRIGRWLGEHAPAGATVATNTAGSIPYFAPQLRAIDMLGLTDRTIAHAERRIGRGYVGHERHDADYVLRQAPDYILLCFSCATAEPCLPSGRALTERRQFRRSYRRHRVDYEGFRFFIYERRAQPVE